MLIKSNYWWGRVKNMLTFPPVHRNVWANWGKIYIFRKTLVLSLYFRGSIYWYRKAKLGKVNELFHSLKTRKNLDWKKPFTFFNFPYCRWESKSTINYAFFKNNTIWDACLLIMTGLASMYQINLTQVK